jgi:DNA-binding Lrp family transcriptional regulator
MYCAINGQVIIEENHKEDFLQQYKPNLQFRKTSVRIIIACPAAVKRKGSRETMDELDCRILQVLQSDFPLRERPYEVLAGKLQISCDELWERVRRLVDQGVIRRIGASLDSRKLGYSSTLAAISVESDRVEQAAEIISQFPEVTHSYQRDHQFNIWFTIISVDNQRIESILEQIRSALSLESSQVLNLPAKRLFKLDARFKSQS